jgi:hypothetical protein
MVEHEPGKGARVRVVRLYAGAFRGKNIMLKITRIAAAGLMFATVFGAAPQAFAWACQAQANDGATGYSYNYPNRRAARQRALAECNARTYCECYIVDCQRHG